MDDYDWHFDYDHDGELDAHEEYDRQDFDDYMSGIGYYDKDNNGSSKGGSHPVYWSVVIGIVLLLLLAFPSSPGLALFVIAFAFSFSFCL